MIGFIKPIKEYIDTREIWEKINKLSFEDILDYLSEYGFLIWKVEDLDLYMTIDFESRHKDHKRVSVVSKNLNEETKLQLAIEKLYSVSLYTERGLRNILRGLVIHEKYSASIGFLLPCEAEVPVKDEERKIVGRADLVCGDYVLELKSGKRNKNHAYQLLIYMDLLNKQKGFLVYEDEVIPYSLDKDEKLLREAYQKLDEVYAELNSISQNISAHTNRFLKEFNITVGELIDKLNSYKRSIKY